MALLSKVGHFLQPSSPGNQTISGIGFTPKVLILFGAGTTSTGWGAQFDLGVGFTAAEGFYAYFNSISASSKNNVTPSNTSSLAQSTCYSMVWGGITYAACTLNSFTSDGFILNWTKYVANQRIGYLALGGDDLTDAIVVAWKPSSGTGNKSVSGVGFKPDCVIHLTDADTSTDHTAIGANFCMGAMDSAGNQWATAAYAINGWSPSNSESGPIANACLVESNNGSYAHFVSMNNDGFTVNFSLNSPKYYYSLCLKGGKYNVGSWTKTTGASGSVDTISLPSGMVPTSVLVNHNSSTNTGQAVDWRVGLGVSDGTNNGVILGVDIANRSPTVSIQAISENFSLSINEGTTQAYNAYGKIGGFADGSFKATWTLNDSNAILLHYVAFGQAAAAAVSSSETVTLSVSESKQPDVSMYKAEGVPLRINEYREINVVGGITHVASTETIQLSITGTSSYVASDIAQVNSTETILLEIQETSFISVIQARFVNSVENITLAVNEFPVVSSTNVTFVCTSETISLSPLDQTPTLGASSAETLTFTIDESAGFSGVSQAETVTLTIQEHAKAAQWSPTVNASELLALNVIEYSDANSIPQPTIAPPPTLPYTLEVRKRSEGWVTATDMGPAACSWGSGSEELFIVLKDGSFASISNTDSWKKSSYISGALASSATAVALGPGEVWLFVRGTDGHGYRSNTGDYGETWTTWNSIGDGGILGTPAAVARGTYIDLFVRGTNNTLYWRTFVASTHAWVQASWVSLGGTLSAPPGACCPMSSNTLFVFARGKNGGCYYRRSNDGGATWGGWTDLGGTIAPATAPTATSSTVGRVDLFVEGTDRSLWHKVYSGGWDGTWHTLGGILTATPSAISNAANEISVFVRGLDGILWRIYTLDGTSWSSWAAVGSLTDFNLLGVLDGRIAPQIQQELGVADLLTFNIKLDDPKAELLTGDTKGIEIWHYGRDGAFKQAYVLQRVEAYGDFGGVSGSGGQTLGSGSGYNLAVSADGPEEYLNRYEISYEYKSSQRMTSQVIKDICTSPINQGILTSTYVDPSLDIPLDVDLSWETIKTGIDKILQQTGGYARVYITPFDPRNRILVLAPNFSNIPNALTPGNAATDAIIVYDYFPPSGNTIPNDGGLAGNSAEGTAYQNDYYELANGAPAWSFNDSADYISIPSSNYVDDLSNATFEFIFQYGVDGSVGTNRYQDLYYKAQTWGAWQLGIDNTGYFYIYRGTANGVWDLWRATASFVVGDWYYVQAVVTSGTPVVHINNANKSMTHTVTGSGGFASDVGNSIYLGNNPDNSDPATATLSFFKLHSSALTNVQLSTSYSQNSWRIDPNTIDARVVYELWPTAGTTILNVGNGGQGYNGTAYQQDYEELGIRALRASASVLYTASTFNYTTNPLTFSGTLTETNDGSAVSGVNIQIQQSQNNGQTWTTVATTGTDASGNWSVVYDLPVGKYLFRGSYAGDSTYTGCYAPDINGETVNVRTAEAYGQWVFRGAGDYIDVPHGSSTDNLTAYTLEFMFYLNGAGGNHTGRLWSKRQIYGAWEVIIDDTLGYVDISRYTANNNVVGWRTPLNSVSVGDWHYLQITQSGAPQNQPAIYLDGVVQALTATGSSTSTAWHLDAWQLASGTGPGVCSWGGGREDTFLVNAGDGTVYHSWDDGTGTLQWENLGGHLTTTPAATAPDTNSIYVFGRGTDGGCWWRSTTNGGTSWTTWASLGGNIVGGPSACSYGPPLSSRIDVFAEGTNGLLYRITSTNSGATWGAWTSTGITVSSPPAAITTGSGDITVFARGSSGALYSTSTTNGGSTWSSWADIGATGATVTSGVGVAACVRPDGTYVVCIEGTDSALWYAMYDGSAWSDFTSLGGTLYSSPAVVSPGDDTIDILVPGGSNALFVNRTQDGGLTWSDWETTSEFDTYLGNNVALTRNFNGSLALYRQHNVALSAAQCASNYAADSWILNGRYEADYSTVQPPIITFGKNMTGVDVLYDYSPIVTKLYPRGTGSAPSEMTLNAPSYYLPLQQLTNPVHNENYIYYQVPGGAYIAYNGFASGTGPRAINMLVGLDTHTLTSFTEWTPTSDPHTLKGGDYSFGAGADTSGTNTVAAQAFIVPVGGAQIHDVRMLLWRDSKGASLSPQTITTIGQGPKFIVGIYTSIPNKTGDRVPYQGPLVWYTGDLYSIGADNFRWYTFPMQGALLPAGFYYVVLSVYPTTSVWPTDFLWWGGYLDPDRKGYAATSNAGIKQNAWYLYTKFDAPYTHFNADFVINTIATDVTDAFFLVDERTIGIYASSWDSSKKYYIHYKLAPYLTAWDSVDKYGTIQGTWKDDTVTTQDALLKSGTQYLTKVAQPVLTWSVGVIDLYDLNPTKNWSEELQLGTNVIVQDEKLGVTQLCMISKLTKTNLDQPHDIQLTLDTILKNTPRLLAETMGDQLDKPKYGGGQTVASPFNVTTQADAVNPAWLEFEIRPTTTHVQSLELSLNAQPFQAAGSGGLTTQSTGDMANTFTIYVDGVNTGITSVCSSLDLLPYVTMNHQGQPTPGWHYVKITPVK